MPATPEDLFAHLDRLGIRTATHRHPPLFTVADSKALRGELPGGHCKSLFLKDKRDRLWLVVAEEDQPVDLKALAGQLGVGRLSFGRPELLGEVLGVIPGAVTPFAVINDRARRVAVILDGSLTGFALLNFHPLTNEATTAIAPGDLLAFLASTGHEPRIMALPVRA